MKYQRALAAAGDRTNEAEVKAKYVSFGGKLLGEVELKEEIKMPEEITPEVVEVTPEVVEPVAEVIEEIPVVTE